MPQSTAYQLSLLQICSLLAVSVFTLGCENKFDVPPPADAPARTSTVDKAVSDSAKYGNAIISAKPVAQPIGPASDNSLSLHEYLDAGVPSPDREWQSQDLMTFLRSLRNLDREIASVLPRHNSEQSGLLFARLTSDENLNFHRNKSLPLQTRFVDALQYGEAFNQLFKHYMNAFSNKTVSDRDVVEMMGMTMQIQVVMSELVDEFVPTLNKRDPTYFTRMEGIDGMKKSWAAVYAGSLRTLTEHHVYRMSELKRFSRYVERTMPGIYPQLTDLSQREILLKLQKFETDAKMSELRPEISRLIETAESLRKRKRDTED